MAREPIPAKYRVFGTAHVVYVARGIARCVTRFWEGLRHAGFVGTVRTPSLYPERSSFYSFILNCDLLTGLGRAQRSGAASDGPVPS